MTSFQRITTGTRALCLAVGLSTAMSGCTAFMEPRSDYPITPPAPSPLSPVPRELDMMSLPRYVIEPPDILLLQAIKVVPKPPHKIEPLDGLVIRVTNTVVPQEIWDAYIVDPEGNVDLGPSYGKVSVVGLTVDEAKDVIRRHLSQQLGNPEVSVTLFSTSNPQQIVGEHLVSMDGRINLGTYGSVFVAGLTVEQAREAIETKLSEKLVDPEVVVDMFAYNSKRYYIITQGAGLGDNVTPLPITGNETVLDAIGNLGGLSQLSSTRIWIARPGPNRDCDQILPVNWKEISQGASTTTNYQLMPGDRLYIAEDPLVKFDAVIAKVTRPFERLFGWVSLGTAMANRIARYGLGNLN